MDYLKKFYLVYRGAFMQGAFTDVQTDDARGYQDLKDAVDDAMDSGSDCIICEVKPIKRVSLELRNIGTECAGRANGGHARAAALSPEHRRDIAKKAALARWHPKPVCAVWSSLSTSGDCRDGGHPKGAHPSKRGA